MKVYIGGKITGNKHFKKQFEEAEKRLRAEGHIVMNPAVLSEGFEWHEYMKICFVMIDICEALYLLTNWKDSRGAKTEKQYSVNEGKIIMYESE